MKTVCVASFGDNIHYTTQALKRLSDEEIVILKDHRCNYPFPDNVQVIRFHAWRPISYLKSIYHLATAKTVLIDNYFGFLGAVAFRKNTTRIQLWHAAGAIKKFGLNDPSISKRSKRAKSRFKKVYQQFQHVTVASNEMARVFQESFGLDEQSIIRAGVPRTDLFFNSEERERIQTSFKKKFPIINEKKVILYAPTYRDNQLRDYKLALDLDELYQELADEYVLFIKQHPAVSYRLTEKHQSFVYDVSYYHDTNHLLLFTDLLITDYSSIPFEYALQHKPMIFFAYDQQTYEKTRGLISNYEQEMPGPIARTTEDVISLIKKETFSLTNVQQFSQKWNEFSDGHSSEDIAKFLLNKRK
ncbi:MAG TPA: CDP-glycerol glycerophosphotransferase family protein [Bacillota bacterium]|nr:CDP-glycerol glycerophosphotransferase family protein [Bacillota bacterium]